MKKTNKYIALDRENYLFKMIYKYLKFNFPS